MPRTLSDEDVDAIVTRLLDEFSKRVLQPAAQLRPTPEPAPNPAALAEAPTKPKLALSLAELAEELGMSATTIYRLVNRGLLKPLPYTRRLIFARTEVERFLSEGWLTDAVARRSRKKNHSVRS